MASPEDLCGHNEARSILVDLYVPCYQAHLTKCLLEVTEFLIGQCLDRGCVDAPVGEHKLFNIYNQCGAYTTMIQVELPKFCKPINKCELS